VVEQNCPYPELDDYDKISYHLLAQKENKMVGTLRIIEFENEVKIGRVAIHQEFRKLGLGKKIMLEAHDFIKSQFPKKQIRISAQQYLEKFYSDLGYEFTGKKYLEDDIPHMEMIKKP
jgi:ElaA protein